MLYIARAKNCLKPMIVILMLLSVLILLLPIHFDMAKYGPTVDGAAVNIVYIMSGLFGIIWTISVMSNMKSLHNHKSIPIMVYCVLGLITAVIQYLIPGLLLITPMETFVTFLMYFTIENPRSEERRVGKECRL